MRKVDVFVLMIVNQLNAVFEHGHHAKSQQIDFDEAQVRTVVFVPLHDDTARHGGRLERHDFI